MEDFFRFPSTPHLSWLNRNSQPREDKVLSPSDATALLKGEVAVEEKIDGANIGISLANDGTLRVQNRGQFLTPPYVGQFTTLHQWLTQHETHIKDHLDPQLILFGEWCAAKHSVSYERLPDWFLLFDVYDRETSQFWSSTRRNALASAARLATVPTLQRGTANMSELKHLLEEGLSCYGSERMEGLIVRSENSFWCESRAKLVRPDFIQPLDEHWSRRRITWNKVEWSTGQFGANTVHL
ncbi:RNA ligase family protein [Pannonibacter sp. SL95]|uniref:RNA ligase family protein n=1 Tax=Pannonibacter sp. SL95 TaxID=2995153 RepID=UPI002272C36B|nr:RNA ligase family protein [Pannonibacter sp. SL95]MCY1705408.1 RNA ligase family protein [Pannonibacter sp. SL95]